MARLNQLCGAFGISFGDWSFGSSINFLDVTLFVDDDGQDNEGLCVHGRILSPGIQFNCKSSNVIYLAQCTICDPVQDNGDINCYAGQTIQPLHKRINDHRSCFDVNENLQIWGNQHCPSMPMSLTKITSTSEILK